MTNGSIVLIYVIIIGLVYLLSLNYGRGFLFLFNFLYRGLLGALSIYLFNILAVNWQLTIPLNPFNALWSGYLGIPGFVGLFALIHWFSV